MIIIIFYVEIVKFLKDNYRAVFSIDTLEDYYYDDEMFKINKLGLKGCEYISEEKRFTQPAIVCKDVVDKTEDGDCVTGVFSGLKTLLKNN